MKRMTRVKTHHKFLTTLRHKRIQTISLVGTLLVALALTGCQTVQQTTSNSKPASVNPVTVARQTPQFTNLLDVDLVQPISTWDAKPVPNQAAESAIRVQTESGQWVTLNAKQHPILFVAYWCPHCQRTLVLMNQHFHSPNDWPTIVYVGYANGFPLSSAVKIADEEKETFHLSFTKPYFLIGTVEKKYIDGFPFLAFADGKQVDFIVGEHTWPMWEKAMLMGDANTGK